MADEACQTRITPSAVAGGVGVPCVAGAAGAAGGDPACQTRMTSGSDAPEAAVAGIAGAAGVGMGVGVEDILVTDCGCGVNAGTGTVGNGTAGGGGVADGVLGSNVRLFVGRVRLGLTGIESGITWLTLLHAPHLSCIEPQNITSGKSSHITSDELVARAHERVLGTATHPGYCLHCLHRLHRFHYRVGQPMLRSMATHRQQVYHANLTETSALLVYRICQLCS